MPDEKSESGFIRLIRLKRYGTFGSMPRSRKRNHCVCPRVFTSQESTRLYSRAPTCTARRKLADSKSASRVSEPGMTPEWLCWPSDGCASKTTRGYGGAATADGSGASACAPRADSSAPGGRWGAPRRLTVSSNARRRR